MNVGKIYAKITKERKESLRSKPIAPDEKIIFDVFRLRAQEDYKTIEVRTKK